MNDDSRPPKPPGGSTIEPIDNRITFAVIGSAFVALVIIVTAFFYALSQF